MEQLLIYKDVNKSDRTTDSAARRYKDDVNPTDERHIRNPMEDNSVSLNLIMYLPRSLLKTIFIFICQTCESRQYLRQTSKESPTEEMRNLYLQ